MGNTTEQKITTTTTITTNTTTQHYHGDVTPRDGESPGCTALMYACQQGDVAQVEKLLKINPALARDKDRTLKTALHYCTETRTAQCADMVYRAAPDLINAPDEDGLTPLHLAVIAGNIPLTNFLLANNVDVNVVDNEKHSVVHWATVCGETAALRAVLLANAPVSTPDVHGGFPLHYAAQMCGAKDPILSTNNTTSIPKSDTKEKRVQSADRDTSKLGLEILDTLLTFPGIRVNVEDVDGRQPLLWAASAGSAAAVLALVAAGSGPEAADKDGLTALHCAASRGHADCLEALLTMCGVATDVIDTNGCTALHYAVTLGHADCTALLLAHGAKVNRQDRRGRTPAHCGCAKGQVETVRMLGAHNADLWIRSARGDLPLHEASSAGRKQLVRWLLSQRPSQVNAKNNDGRTSLHYAALNDNTDVCKILLDHGANVNSVMRTSKNVLMTPLDCALKNGYRSTAKFLQLNGGLPFQRLRIPISENDGINVHLQNDITIQRIKQQAQLNSESEDEIFDGKQFVGKSQKRRVFKHRRKVKVSDEDESQVQHEAPKTKKTVGLNLSSSSSGSQSSSATVKIQPLRRVKTKTKESQTDERFIIIPIMNSELSKQQETIKKIETIIQKEGGDIISGLDVSNKSMPDNANNKFSMIDLRSLTDSNLSDNNSLDCVKITEVLVHANQDDDHDMHENVAENDVDVAKDDPSGETVNQDKVLDDSEANNVTTDVTAPADTKTEEVVQNEVSNVSLSTPKDEPTSDVEVKEPDTTPAAIEEDVPTNASQNDEETKENETETLADIDNVEETNADTEDQPELVDSKGPEPEDDALKQDIPPSSEDNTLNVETTSNIPETVIDTEIETVEVTNPETLEENLPEIEETVTQVDDCLTPAASVPEDESTKIEEPDEQKGADAENKELILENEEAKTTSDEVETVPDLQIEEPTSQDQTNIDIPPEEVIEEVKEVEIKTEDNQNDVPPGEIEKEDGDKSFKSFQVLPENTSNKYLPQSKTEIDNEVSELVPDQRKQAMKSKQSSSKRKDTEKYKSKKKSTNEALRKSSPKNVEDMVLTPRLQDENDEIDQYSSFESDKDDKDDSDKQKHLHIKHQVFESPFSDESDLDQEIYRRNEARKRRSKRSKSAGRESYNSDGQMLDSGFEPSPRNSRIPRRSLSTKPEINMTTVTQTVQGNIRRYHLERKIFQHLLELKRLQIRSGQSNEAVLVKRAIDEYHQSILSTVGAGRYKKSDYTFKSFEKFLYDSLRKLQKGHIPPHLLKLPETAPPPLLCTHSTMQCDHATHAYTGIPCAAYITKLNHHTIPKVGFGVRPGGFLPRLTSNKETPKGHVLSKGSVTLELTHGADKQFVTLPADRLDQNKKYFVTFTVKGLSNTETNLNNDTSSHRHAKSC